MEAKLFLKAYAKINLLLDVLEKRPDGLHELEGVMQSVSLADEITLEPAEGIEIVCDAPLPYNNTCRRAAEAFLGGSGYGARIEVRKRIPSEAGLGGASADAAAILRGLNELYRDTPLRRGGEELFSLGLKVGADVPFCLLGGCAIARGVGEKLTQVNGMELPLLIVRGSRGVSTGKLFGSLGIGAGKRSRLQEGALAEALCALEENDVDRLCGALGNALMPAAEREAPEIGGYAERMKKAGALGSCMTGSGAAVFGIFESEEAAIEAKKEFSDCEFAGICKALTGIGRRPNCVTVAFRKGDERDAELTARLKRAAWETTYRGIYPDELINGWDPAERTERERTKFLTPGVTGWVIEADGEPCGFMFLRDGEAPYIMALYLLKEYRGLGIGTHAFGLVREYCRTRGRARFTCSCNAYNSPALAFYASMGGREIGRSMGHENKRDDQVELEFDA